MNKKGSKTSGDWGRATIAFLPDQRRPLSEVAEAIRKDQRSGSKGVRNRRVARMPERRLQRPKRPQGSQGAPEAALRLQRQQGKKGCTFHVRYKYSAKKFQNQLQNTVSTWRICFAPQRHKQTAASGLDGTLNVHILALLEYHQEF